MFAGSSLSECTQKTHLKISLLLFEGFSKEFFYSELCRLKINFAILIFVNENTVKMFYDYLLIDYY